MLGASASAWSRSRCGGGRRPQHPHLLLELAVGTAWLPACAQTERNAAPGRVGGATPFADHATRQSCSDFKGCIVRGTRTRGGAACGRPARVQRAARRKHAARAAANTCL
eukprot:203360-Chlamydomonas_euryale.AAC.1